MPSCAVKSCKNRTGAKKKVIPGLKYFSFPRDERIAKQWIEACGNPNVSTKYGTICSIHFDESCLKKDWRNEIMNYSPVKCRKIKPDAVPTLFLGMQSTKNTIQETPTRVDSMDETYNIEMISLNRSLLFESPDTKENCNTHKKEAEVEESPYITTSSTSTAKITSCSSDLSPGDVREDDSVLNASQQETVLEAMRKKIQAQEEEIINLKRKLKEVEPQVKEVTERLSVSFSKGTVRRMLHPSLMDAKWSPEDIVSAISLRCITQKGYNYLRVNRKIPLPAPSTLRRWISNIDFEEGILTTVINYMKEKSSSMQYFERLTVISIDEMRLSNTIEIDRKREQMIGPHESVQCVMARGLFGHWKQPVFFGFDKSMTKNLLYTILKYLYEAHFTVVAIVSDIGPNNLALWKELNIDISTYDTVATNQELPSNMYCSTQKEASIEEEKQIPARKTFFCHPCESDLKVFVFADVSHLLKLLRNHFVDTGFTFNGLPIDKTSIEELIQINTEDLEIAPKISNYHLDVKVTDRQKVFLAAQLFSNTTATAIEWAATYLNQSIKASNWELTANAIRLVNDWFDLHNSRSRFGHNEISCGYGINLETQNELLEKMSSWIEMIKVGANKSLIPFQKGILVSNTSLRQILPYLQQKYNTSEFTIDYILTNRLTQDVLEHFFSFIRYIGGSNDHPSALNFKYGLRSYILGMDSDSIFSTEIKHEDERKYSPEKLTMLTDDWRQFHKPDEMNMNAQ